MAAAASVGASIKGLGRSFGPSLAEDADENEPGSAPAELEPAPSGRTLPLRSLALPAALGIALLIVIGVLALGAGASFGSPGAQAGASNVPGGALVIPSAEVTPEASAETQPADASGGGGKGRGKGKGGR
jgi:hypothetical protein